jgi:hypothetical protein
VVALLYWFSTDLLAAAFPCQRLLDAFLFTRFQVKGMSLYFLNDVFLLNLSFETPQRIFD